jgi:hypothetical protein
MKTNETKNRKLEMSLSELTSEFEKRFIFVKNMKTMMLEFPKLEECCSCNTIKDVVSCSMLFEDEVNFKEQLVEEVTNFLRRYSSALSMFKLNSFLIADDEERIKLISEHSSKTTTLVVLKIPNSKLYLFGFKRNIFQRIYNYVNKKLIDLRI